MSETRRAGVELGAPIEHHKERDGSELMGRVVRVIARLNVGGPAQQAIQLSVALADSFPTVLAFGEVARGEADMSGQAAARGATIRRVKGLGRRIHPLDDLRAFLHLYRLMREIRPQIVHTHTAKAGTVGRLAALAARVPIRVHTFHGHVFRGYFGRWTTRIFIWIERVLARATTAIIAISESQRSELVEEFRICQSDRVRVVPLGLELDRFSAERGGPLRDEFRRELDVGAEAVISIVGRLVPIKNHDLFLQVAARLVRSGRRCVFVIVGGGPEDSRLRDRTRDLGLEKHVRFLGWREDVERVYAGSDLVVLTSNNEGTPVCLIEALAAGLPVVATNVGGVCDVLDDGRLGVLVPPEDPEALADAISDLIDRPEQRRDLGRLGRESAPVRYGARRLAEDMEDLYNSLARHVPKEGHVSFSIPGAK